MHRSSSARFSSIGSADFGVTGDLLLLTNFFCLNRSALSIRSRGRSHRGDSEGKLGETALPAIFFCSTPSPKYPRSRVEPDKTPLRIRPDACWTKVQYPARAKLWYQSDNESGLGSGVIKSLYRNDLLLRFAFRGRSMGCRSNPPSLVPRKRPASARGKK